MRAGWGLLLAYERNVPFRLAPARAQDWEAAPEGPGWVWGRVGDHLPLTGGTERPGGQVTVFCELPGGASLITSVGVEVPVVLRPESPRPRRTP
ncbi:hypothetical protein [Streptosporangium sp. NPDC006007]|uniref:hypothetical protein n=1 Tax=Streptosporangium sp. NPDC006007 TaxID=3154575 RepID=UPI0033B8E4AE